MTQDLKKNDRESLYEKERRRERRWSIIETCMDAFAGCLVLILTICIKIGIPVAIIAITIWLLKHYGVI